MNKQRGGRPEGGRPGNKKGPNSSKGPQRGGEFLAPISLKETLQTTHTQSITISLLFLAPGPRGDKGKPAKKNSKEDLDADLDSYFLKDEKTAAQVGTGTIYVGGLGT